MLINNVTDFTKHISCLGLFEVNNAALIITLPDDTTVTVRTLDGHEGECNLVITLDSKILLNSDVTYEIAADALRFYSNLAHYDIGCADAAGQVEAPFGCAVTSWATPSPSTRTWPLSCSS